MSSMRSRSDAHKRSSRTIAECAKLKASLDTCPPGPKRRGLLEEYETNRLRAVEQRWYLEVQREAMGLRKHTDLDQFFPLPPAIRD